MVNDEPKASQLVTWIVDKAVEGVPPLSSASNLAKEYIIDASYTSNDERVASLIKWETSKNFTAGFITGMGGLLTLPVAVPAAFGASWLIQARMAGAIAVIDGHELEENRVRTLVLLSIIGDSAKEVLKQAGVKVAGKLTEKVVMKVPGKVLIEINKRVGFRLLTKAGEKGALVLMKGVPVVGGVVGGAFDAVACRTVGNLAHSIFKG